MQYKVVMTREKKAKRGLLSRFEPMTRNTPYIYTTSYQSDNSDHKCPKKFNLVNILYLTLLIGKIVYDVW